jgi:cell wall-associated NlpC family hydrolase
MATKRKSLVKKVISTILVIVAILVAAIATIVVGVAKGSLIVAGAFSGNPGDIATLSLLIAQEFTPQPIDGYACIDPNALETGQKGTAAATANWPDAVIYDSEGNNQLAAVLFTAGYLASNGQIDRVTEDGRYGVYGLTGPGSGTNYGITAKEMLNPALATNFMLPRFQNAMNVINPELWAADPAKAAAAIAYAALQPDEPYTAAEIQAAWAKTVTELHKLKIPDTFDTPPISTENVTGSVLARNPLLFGAINAASQSDPNLQLALLMGSYLESNWRSDASGGGAYGVFQIQHPAGAPEPGPPVHPDITLAQALDPVYATGYMLAAYKAAMDPDNPNRKVSFPSSLWTGNPELAAEYTVYNAEMPAALYHETQGQARVDEAYHASLLVMQALGSSTQFVDTQCASVISPQLIIGLNVGLTGADRQTVIKAAQDLLGTPYSFGGGHSSYMPSYGQCSSDPTDAGRNDCHIAGVDCSGLTRIAFHAAGIIIGDTAADQWHKTKQWQVPMDKAQPGDLLFWTGYTNSYTDPGHVAIYIGGGKAIMAPQSGDVVKIADITTPFWQSEFVGATSPYHK